MIYGFVYYLHFVCRVIAHCTKNRHSYDTEMSVQVPGQRATRYTPQETVKVSVLLLHESFFSLSFYCKLDKKKYTCFK